LPSLVGCSCTTRLASTPARFLCCRRCAQDGTVVVWKQTEAGGEWTSDRLSKFPAAVWRVSWSITGNILAVSGREQRLVRARHARRVLSPPPPSGLSFCRRD
jgi:hypothetical protein